MVEPSGAGVLSGRAIQHSPRRIKQQCHAAQVRYVAMMVLVAVVPATVVLMLVMPTSTVWRWPS